jgi:DNA-binding IclR family transcriptional regulator
MKLTLRYRAPKIVKILHYLKQSPFGLTPRQLSTLTGLDPNEIEVLLDYSERHGWVENPEWGVYKITAAGIQKILDLEVKINSESEQVKKK